MFDKPIECQACPMYQNGKGFVPDEIVEGSEVFVLMQNPGEDEEEEGRPAIGKTGKLMNEKFLAAAGLFRGENVSVGNVLKCRWEGKNKLPPAEILNEAVEYCMRSHLRIPQSTKLIVAQGELASSATGNKLSIDDWRGFLLPKTVTIDEEGRVTRPS